MFQVSFCYQTINQSFEVFLLWALRRLEYLVRMCVSRSLHSSRWLWFFLLWLWSREQSYWKKQSIFQFVHIVARMEFKEHSSQFRILLLNLASEDLSLRLVKNLHPFNHCSYFLHNPLHIFKSTLLCFLSLLLLLSFLFFFYLSLISHPLRSYALLLRIRSQVQFSRASSLHSCKLHHCEQDIPWPRS